MTKMWLPLESNPEVLNDFLKSLGLPEPKVVFCDVFGLDDELLAMLPRPVYAMIFLYPLSDAVEAADTAACLEQRAEVAEFMKENKFFYSKQTIPNACGTMAVLHAILNNMDVVGNVLEGSPVAEFLRGAAGASPEEVAKLIESDLSLDRAHALASVSGVTENQPLDADIDLHFTCFVRIGDRCVELDGRKPHPLLHGYCWDEESFVSLCAITIKRKMERDPESPRFSIIALCQASE